MRFRDVDSREATPKVFHNKPECLSIHYQKHSANLTVDVGQLDLCSVPLERGKLKKVNYIEQTPVRDSLKDIHIIA